MGNLKLEIPNISGLLRTNFFNSKITAEEIK